MFAASIAAAATAATMTTAIVTTDHAVLRAGAREAAPSQAQLWQGEVLEVRGERLDYLQVWDHQRERGGYVRASQVRRITMTPADAPDLLAVLRFVRDAPGAESLGIGLAVAYLQAAEAQVLRGPDGADALDALGTFAERLAQRASSGGSNGKQTQATLSAHLDVASRYGVKFLSYEQDGRMRICYDGDAFRRVLALPARPEQKARAALAITQAECIASDLPPMQRHQYNLWRADVLDHVEGSALPPYLRNRLALRRASVWSTLAYEHTRFGQPAQPAAQRALAELASVSRTELSEDDEASWNEAAMRVNASRWAAIATVPVRSAGTAPSIVTQPGSPGETCVLLLDAKHDVANPLAKRCTYALVWPQSATVNREGNAAAVAVQPLEAWCELWLFRKRGAQWTIDVVPPAGLTPQLGYAEFAGWVPGGQQMLLAREARAEGRYRRSFEVLGLDSLAAQRQSPDASTLGPFQRWQDPAWKRMTVSIR